MTRIRLSARSGDSEMSGFHRFTEAQVVEIRERYARGEKGCELVKVDGVSNATISHIVTGEMWRTAGGPITPKGAVTRHGLACATDNDATHTFAVCAALHDSTSTASGIDATVTAGLQSRSKFEPQIRQPHWIAYLGKSLNR